MIFSGNIYNNFPFTCIAMSLLNNVPLLNLCNMIITAVDRANDKPTDGGDLALDFSTEENSSFSCKTQNDISDGLKRRRGRPRNNLRKQKLPLGSFTISVCSRLVHHILV